MARISESYGILIHMDYPDHAAPLFHAMYGRFEAWVSSESAGTLTVQQVGPGR